MPISSHLFLSDREKERAYCQHVVPVQKSGIKNRNPAGLRFWPESFFGHCVCKTKRRRFVSCFVRVDRTQGKTQTDAGQNGRQCETKSQERRMEIRKAKWQFLCPDMGA